MPLLGLAVAFAMGVVPLIAANNDKEVKNAIPTARFRLSFCCDCVSIRVLDLLRLPTTALPWPVVSPVVAAIYGYWRCASPKNWAGWLWEALKPGRAFQVAIILPFLLQGTACGPKHPAVDQRAAQDDRAAKSGVREEARKKLAEKNVPLNYDFLRDYAENSVSPEIVGLLIDAGLDPNHRFQGGGTPLMIAAGSGQPEVVKVAFGEGSARRRSNRQERNRPDEGHRARASSENLAGCWG
jgi:hypothetical protein